MNTEQERIAFVGGRVIDGTGRRSMRADVIVQGSRLVAVGPNLPRDGSQVVDINGSVVCPGFIDSHTHDDVALLEEPEHVHAVQQGVTTVIVGQDGLSFAPLGRDNQEEFRKYLAGIYGEGGSTDWKFQTIGEYLRMLDGSGVNAATCVPHGAVRLEAGGFEDQPLVGAKLEHAVRLVAEGFADGAVGLSSGLSYYPGAWSDTDELVELSRVAAAWRRPYVTHLRSVYREEPSDRLAAGIAEALEVGRRSGAALHFSHYRTWSHNVGETAAILAAIDDAKRDGQDVSLELYPYLTGSSFAVLHLPPWAQAGGSRAILERLRDPVQRESLRQGVLHTGVPHDGRITYALGNPRLEGLTLAEICRSRGSGLVDTLLDLMAETQLGLGLTQSPPTDPDLWRRFHLDVLELLDRTDYMVGSDSIPTGSRPHPRVSGAFPKILRLQREFRTISLERVINRMTCLPARRFGLAGRGVLKPGAAADVVVFDPEAVSESSTDESPWASPQGIQYVLVNGVPVVNEGVATGERPGFGLRWGGGRAV